MPLASPLASPPQYRPSDTDRLLDFIHAAGGAGRRLRALLDEHLCAFDLQGAECLVLWLCGTRTHHAGSSQQELAAAIGVSPAQMSSLVEGLRKRGLMEMKRSSLDRRRQVWRLVAQGEELLGQIRASLGTVAQQIDRLVPAHEQEAAQLLFARLADPPGAIPAALRSFDPDRPDDSTESTATKMQGGDQ